MTSPIKIFGVPVSQNVRKVLAVARHLDMPVEIAPLPPRDAALLSVSPSGRIPAMEDNGFTLCESNAILIYLASKKPTALYPEDPQRRARIHQWMFWDSAHWTPAYQPIQFERLVKPKFYGGAPDEGVIEKALAAYNREAALLNAALDGNDWLTGDGPSLADFSVGAGFTYAALIDLPLLDYPNIRAWYERLSALEAWKASTPPMS